MRYKSKLTKWEQKQVYRYYGAGVFTLVCYKFGIAPFIKKDKEWACKTIRDYITRSKAFAQECKMIAKEILNTIKERQ